MANNFTAAALAGADAYYTALADGFTDLESLLTMRYGSREQASYKALDLTGIGAHAAQGADGVLPSLDSIERVGTGYAPTAYEDVLGLSDQQIAQQGADAFTVIGTALAQAAISDLTKLAWTALAGADAVVHANALQTVSGPATAYMADTAFTLPTGLAQANLVTTALSAAALSTAIGTINGWKNADGRPTNWGSDPLALVVPPALTQTARNLVGRTKEEWDGSSLQAGNFGIERVIVNRWALDSNDWFILGMGGRNPLGLWVPLLPRVRFTLMQNDQWQVSSNYEAVAFWKPESSGLYMGKVAGGT